jgi:hypothetical protein
VRVAFVFEPLAPTAITFFLGRRLNEWKEQGIISDYKSRTHRLGKFHYKIEIDFDVTSSQAQHVLNNLMPDQLNSVRRWVNG